MAPVMQAKVDESLLGGCLESFAMDAIRNIQARANEYKLQFLRQTAQPLPENVSALLA